MLLSLVWILIGFTLLLLGGEWVVSHAVQLAQKLRIRESIIGVTIVAIGTSLPELSVSTFAGMRGNADIAIANVVGSNIMNIALVLGLVSLILPIHAQDSSLRYEWPVLFASTVALGFFLNDLNVTSFEGFLLIIGLFGFILFLVLRILADRKKDNQAEASMGSEVALNFEIKEQSEDLSQKKNQVFLHLFFITIGLAALIAGGNLSLEGATSIARLLGVSERVIGLTIIAIGTSLPELVTSLIAVYRKYEEIALSNILGSNIFNSLGVIGAASLFGDLHVSTKIVSYDYFYMLGVLVLLFPFMFFLKKIPRLGGAFFILVWLYYNFSLI